MTNLTNLKQGDLVTVEFTDAWTGLPCDKITVKDVKITKKFSNYTRGEIYLNKNFPVKTFWRWLLRKPPRYGYLSALARYTVNHEEATLAAVHVSYCADGAKMEYFTGDIKIIPQKAKR